MKIWLLSLLGSLAQVNALQFQEQIPLQNNEYGWHIEEQKLGEWTEVRSSAAAILSVLERPRITNEWEYDDDEGLEDDQEFVDKTIYEVLKAIPVFSRILKAVNFDEETAKLFNDASANITFFAPDNQALPSRPDRRRSFTPHDLSLISVIDDLESSSDGFADDDKDKKKLLKKLVHAILSYHILPEGLDGRGLGLQLTHATSLEASDGSIGGSARRIHVFPPIFRKRGGLVNLYAKIKRLNIRTKNGVIHVINHPLLPPLSALESTFLLQDAFSIWTSSLQKVNLSDATEYRVLPEFIGVPNKTSAPAVTIFLPVNSAWRHLPKGLQLYLFSPFGQRALKKLLQLHIVPNFVLHSDWSYNASSSESFHGQPMECCLSAISADHVNTHLWSEDKYMHLDNLSPDAHVPPPFGCSPSPPQALLPELLNSMRIPHRSPRLPMNVMPGGGPCHCIKERFEFWGPPEVPKPPKLPKLPPMPTKIPEPPKMPHPPSPPRPPHLPRPPVPPRRPPAPPHPRPPRHKPKLSLNETVVLPTLLTNFTVNVHITRVEHGILPPSFSTRIVANGVPVALVDGIARNGAVHVITRLLHPFPKRHRRPPRDVDCEMHSCSDIDPEFDAEDWEDWKDWLPQWAAED